MKQTPQRLIKRTAFVFRSQQTIQKLSTDPTNSSIIIIATETLVNVGSSVR